VLRLAAIAFLGSALLYLAVGIVHTYHPFWFGPAPWYFEGFLFPFHGIFAAILLSELVRVAIQLVPPERYFLRYGSSPAVAALLTLTIAAVPWFHVRERQNHVPPSPPLGYEAYPQPETAITRVLKDEIALSPGASFRGREATLVGRIFPLSTSVSNLSGIEALDLLALHATGNYHDYAGLWQDAIPTLLEYNPLMTPAYFVFGRTFFTEPADVQIRNLLIMRRIDPRILAAVGVRFVVRDRCSLRRRCATAADASNPGRSDAAAALWRSRERLKLCALSLRARAGQPRPIFADRDPSWRDG
jgi:hypothetical protein